MGAPCFLTKWAHEPQDASKVLRSLEGSVSNRWVRRPLLKWMRELLAATNKNLEEEIERRNFREDLFLPG